MKRNALMVLLIIALVALMAGGTYAWFTAQDAKTNTFTAGTEEIEILEKGENGEPSGGGIVVNNWTGTSEKKEVRVKSLGSKQTYVRVALTPVWYSEAGDPEPSLPVDNVGLNLATGYDDNWVYLDGWYYYKKILNQNNETELLLASVALGNTEGYDGKVLQIVVNAEAVQASHEAYQDAWGIDSLPAGVEEWQQTT